MSPRSQGRCRLSQLQLAVGFDDHAMGFEGPRVWVVLEFFVAVSIVVHEARAFRVLKTLMKHIVTDANGVEPFRAAVLMSGHGCKGWLGVPGALGRLVAPALDSVFCDTSQI